MLRFEQSPIESEAGGTATIAPSHGDPAPAHLAIRSPDTRRDVSDAAAQRAARRSLKAQIAKLEQELSAIVADGFPFIASPQEQAIADGAPAPRAAGPRLCDLAELERVRDQLAGRVQELRGASAERAELESLARETLERMKLEPGRYKFVRLPVSDLGQGGCGVWEVRPRLGLIGMLAGWWEITLSSGCP